MKPLPPPPADGSARAHSDDDSVFDTASSGGFSDSDLDDETWSPDPHNGAATNDGGAVTDASIDDMQDRWWEGPRSTIMPQNLPLMAVSFPHHKTAKSRAAHPLTFMLPYDLALTTHLYMRYAYPLLNVDGAHDTFFVRTGVAGGPMLDEHLSMLWREIQRRYDAPWVPFPPSSFRHINVKDKVADINTAAAAVGMDLRGDAALMANTAGPLWENSYMKRGLYLNSMTDGVIDRVTARRHAQLRAMRAAVAAGEQSSPVGGAS
jgi:hypothetical protein